jgi:hypothetical protein
VQLHHTRLIGIVFIAAALWTFNEAYATPHWRKIQLSTGCIVLALGAALLIISFI